MEERRNYMDSEYYAAERLGTLTSGSCHLLYSECQVGLLDFISEVQYYQRNWYQLKLYKNALMFSQTGKTSEVKKQQTVFVVQFLNHVFKNNATKDGNDFQKFVNIPVKKQVDVPDH